MHEYKIPTKNLRTLTKRYRNKETDDLRITVPIIIPLIVFMFYDRLVDSTIEYILMFIFVFGLLILQSYTRSRATAKHKIANFSIGFEGNILIAKQGRIVRNFNLLDCQFYSNKYDELIIKAKKSKWWQGLVMTDMVKIPPEIECFDQIKDQILNIRKG